MKRMWAGIKGIHTTGDHIKWDPQHTQKPIYLPIFTHNIWSYLLWSPVIVLGKQTEKGRHGIGKMVCSSKGKKEVLFTGDHS